MELWKIPHCANHPQVTRVSGCPGEVSMEARRTAVYRLDRWHQARTVLPLRGRCTSVLRPAAVDREAVRVQIRTACGPGKGGELQRREPCPVFPLPERN